MLKAFACCVCLHLFCFSAGAAAPEYQLTDLSFLNTPFVKIAPKAINNAGDIAGIAAAFYDGSFLYRGGDLMTFVTLGGLESEAYGLNDAGYVVGRSMLPGGDWATSHAYLYKGSVTIDLGTLGGPTSTAYAVNNRGQVVGGAAPTGSLSDYPFIYSDGVMRELGALPGGAGGVALDINESGDVVGYAGSSMGLSAFLYRDGTMINLDSFASGWSKATGINDHGQVIGLAWRHDVPPRPGYDDFFVRSFLFSDGVMTDLGMLDGGVSSAPYDINNHGHVVGGSATASGQTTAYLYRNGVMEDLNTLIDSSGVGWHLSGAHGINDMGWIIGHGVYNGSSRAVLLTPIPEPSASALVGVAFMLMLARPKQRPCKDDGPSEADA